MNNTQWWVLIGVSVVAMLALIGIYFQMKRCGAVLDIINEKGGPDQVCGWAATACGELMETGVISRGPSQAPSVQ